ncbi:MAG: magnesium and cobalt transport protein CorA [bacterium]
MDHVTAIVDCAVYRDGVRQPGTPTWQGAIRDVRSRGDGFVWIGLHEPSPRQLGGIADALGLHPLAVEDAIHAHQRPKVDRYEDSLFAVVKTVHYNDDGQQKVEVVESGEVMLFLGPDFVVTVRHGEHGGLHRVRLALETRPDMLRLGPSSVLHAVLDHVVDEYLHVVDELQTDIDQIETAVFDPDNRGSRTGRIYLLKREVVELRRALAPLSAPLAELTDHPSVSVAEPIRAYFRDVDDHLRRAVDQVTSFDDLLNTLVSANLAQAGIMQNEDMRKISAWVAIVAVPTMVAGIYGMNFTHMPELGWKYGYPTVLAGIAVVCSFLFRAFKRNGWL